MRLIRGFIHPSRGWELNPHIAALVREESLKPSDYHLYTVDSAFYGGFLTQQRLFLPSFFAEPQHLLHYTNVGWDGFHEWLVGRGYAVSYVAEVLKRLRNDWNLIVRGDFLAVCRKSNGLASLTLLMKFLGCYDAFRLWMKRHDVHWQHSNGDAVFSWIVGRSGLVKDTEEWMEKCRLANLGWEVWNGLVFGFLSGLRTGEWIACLNKVASEGLDGYYDAELGCLLHGRDKRFLRMTKKAWITPVSDRMLAFLECWMERKPRLTRDLIRSRLRLKGLSCWTYNLRKMHGTVLRENGIPSEIVDVTEGRCPGSIFGKYYFSADLKKWFKRILDVLKPYEERWLDA